MKKHFWKKRVFSLCFLTILYVFAGFNFVHQVPMLMETIEESSVSWRELPDMLDKVEATINDTVLGKFYFIEAYGLTQKVLNKKEIDDFSYIKDENGFLNFSNFWNDVPTNTKAYAKSVQRLQTIADKQGAQVIALIPPTKYIEGSSLYEKGLPYSDRNWIADDYMKKLEGYDIPVIDFRKELADSGMAYEDIMYKTDHHWTNQGAFYAFGALVENLNQRFDAKLDVERYYRDIQNYEVITYKNSFLGSQGRETGVIYSGLDDYSLILPKFDTFYKYSFAFSDYSNELQGRFEDTLVFKDALKNDNIYESNKYLTYLNGVAYQDKITNYKNPEGPRVLFLRDSYCSPLAAFFSSVCSQMNLIWTINYEEDIEEYLEKNQYDYIFISFYPDSITDEMFRFLMEEGE